MQEIKTWEDVDLALKELGELEIKKNLVEGVLNETIAKAKAEAKEELEPVIKRAKELTKMIEIFAASKKDEFAKKRSKELTFGKVGFRLVTSVPVPRDKQRVEALIKSLKAFGLDDCVIYEEKPNKDKLKELDDSTLAKLGLEKKVKDSFRVEPFLEKIKGE